MKKIIIILFIILVIFGINYLFYSEADRATELTARYVAIGAAIHEFGDKEYYIDNDVGSFRTLRKNIENELHFIASYQNKSYYRVIVKDYNDSLSIEDIPSGSGLHIIYTIDAASGNVISRQIGNNIKWNGK